MANDPCVGCGASSGGVFVCHHCGVPIRTLGDAESERRALDELHGQLATDNPPPRLLDNAFLPDNPRVLIDAGLRLLPVLENGAGQSNAAGRMRAIIIKLRLLGDDPAVTRAAKEFQDALDSYRVSDRRMGYAVGIVLVVVIAGVVAISQSCG
ncbi:MAG TPA: hypothetical protein VK034_15490 [Enhygromyxa sp.]|nr:hypothetical protein [Enhygromyxa sp.]